MIKKKLPVDQHKYFENGQIAIDKYQTKIVLIVWNFNLEDCKSRYNLKYFYFAVPLYPKLLSEELLSDDFSIFKAKIQGSFKLNQKQIFLFLQNGTQLQSLADIPVQNYFILLSTSGSFHDLSKYKNYIKLEHIFKQLQFPLIDLQNDKLKDYRVQSKVEVEFKDVVVDVIDLLSHDNDINGDGLETMVKAVKNCQKTNRQMSEVMQECRSDQLEQQRMIHEGSNVMMVKTPMASQKQMPNSATFSEFSKFLQLKKMKSLNEKTFLSPTGQKISAQMKMLGKNSRLLFKTEEEYFDEKNQDKPLIKSKFHDVYNICEKYYERPREVIQNQESDGSEKEEKGNEDNNELSSKQIAKMQHHLENLIDQWKKEVSQKNASKNTKKQKKPKKSTVDEADVECGYVFEGINDEVDEDKIKNENKNFLKQNIEFVLLKLIHNRRVISKKRIIQKISRNNKEILQETHFERKDLHQIYTLYKTLHEVTSQRHDLSTCLNGVDYDTFRNGIYHVFVQSEVLQEKIFQSVETKNQNFLNWPQFLQLMSSIQAKTLRDKIDLFVKIADEDGNGNLSYEEIFSLSKICLSKYIKIQNEDEFLDDLCHYFTRLIFSVMEIDLDEEIPMDYMKEKILSVFIRFFYYHLKGNQEQALLTMFCGADI